jgi:hypothetical protein
MVVSCSFYYGSHNSSMEIILHYLLRPEPSTSLQLNFQVVTLLIMEIFIIASSKSKHITIIFNIIHKFVNT